MGQKTSVHTTAAAPSHLPPPHAALADEIRSEREAKEAKRQRISLTGTAAYDRLVVACDDLVRGRYQSAFDLFVMTLIAVAAGTIGAQTYDIDLTWVDTTDDVLWVFFLAEIIVKLISEGAKPCVECGQGGRAGERGTTARPLLPSLPNHPLPRYKILYGNPDALWNTLDIAVVIVSNPLLNITR